MKYLDVILPLPLNSTFTYLLPKDLDTDKVCCGCRAVVPFGNNKLYTSIIVDIKSEISSVNFEIKEVVDILDEKPILFGKQIKFWNWISNYYLCAQGDVMKAALPSGLRAGSETMILRNEGFDEWNKLTKKEMSVMALVKNETPISVVSLQKATGDKHILRTVKSLMKKDVIGISENIVETYKPRYENHVRLVKEYFDEDRLNILLSQLERTPKRYDLVMQYLNISGYGAAVTLKNPNIIKEVSRVILLKKTGISAAVLSALCSKGIMEIYKYEVNRIKPRNMSLINQLPLSDAQQKAYNDINSKFQEKNICLLHGVTSSGKTEIYIRLIRDCLNKGKQVLYLLPEIALTTQITTRLQRVFGDKMGVYHSKFPDNERVEIWHRQLSDKPYELILGVRSALFLPYKDLGLIIVDEEHETSYKQQDPAPRYNARDMALVLAGLYGCKALLGTATPSLETYNNVKKGKYGYVKLTQRYGGVMMPKIEIVDVKELLRKKMMTPPLSPRLEEEIGEALKNKEQVILFQNRRGYAPMIECKKCGWVPTCAFCDVALTYHQSQNKMVCHYCGSSFDVPTKCPCCEEEDLKSFGFGTEQVEEIVRKKFPMAVVDRLDFDSTRKRNSYEQIISNFAEGHTDILIGTQMVSKGLDFDNVHVVGILDADTMLTRPDFRSYERSFQMMAQVSGRAGRHNRQGYVILQTKRADYDIVQQVIDNDYHRMAVEQLKERKDFCFPPFTRLIYLYLKHKDDSVVEEAAKQLTDLLCKYFDGNVLGPDKPLISRVQLMYIRKIAIKVEADILTNNTRRILRNVILSLNADSRYKSVQVYFDVDPL